MAEGEDVHSEGLGKVEQDVRRVLAAADDVKAGLRQGRTGRGDRA